ncbi:MAG: hypothetical protein WAN29_19980 [Candidatus Sulfotelmatobacter sp.]
MRRITIALAILGVAMAGGGAAEANHATKWPNFNDIKSGSGEPLEKAGLPPAELKLVRAALNDLANGKGCQGARVESCDAPESLFLAKVKITTDRQTAVILRGPSIACGTAGCQIWVIQTSGKVLIEDFGWGYSILPSHEHRYFDVVTAAGNHRVGLVMWSFDGEHYRVFRCASTEATGQPGPPPQVSEQSCPVSIQ